MTSPGVLVTRPREQSDVWVRRFRARGIPAEALPLLAIRPAADPALLRQALLPAWPWDLIMFVSPSAVHQAAAAVGDAWAAWPTQTWAAAPGPGTVRALEQLGVPPQQLIHPPVDAQQFDSETLWPVLARQSWQGRRVLIVRGHGGREWLAEQLQAAGAVVHTVSAYRRGAPEWTEEERTRAVRAVEDPSSALWLVTSSEALGHLPALLQPRPCESEARLAQWAGQARMLTTHPRILEQAQRMGFARAGVCRPDLDDIVAAYNDVHRGH